MNQPSWIWPHRLNDAGGLGVRLGRVMHWTCVAAGSLLMGLACLMAAVALLSDVANAQDSSAFNEASPAMQQVIRDQRALKEEPPKASLPEFETRSRPETGTIADAVEPLPDYGPVTGTRIDLKERSKVDWELFQQALALFGVGLLLVLAGRALRYILSNE